MCGRFTLRANPAAIQQAFQLDEFLRIEARFNVAPSQQVLAVCLFDQGKVELPFLRMAPWPTHDSLMPLSSIDAYILHPLSSARDALGTFSKNDQLSCASHSFPETSCLASSCWSV
jgi:putative SOS response-associated peptidase YedK